jgi:hypothetical protein
MIEDREASALDVIPNGLKAAAIEFIRRQSLMNDRVIQAMFCSSVNLTRDETIDTEALINAVAEHFPTSMRERFLSIGYGFTYEEAGVGVYGTTMSYRDDNGEEWIVFAAGTPIASSDPSKVVNMNGFVNNINKQVIGLACASTISDGGDQTAFLFTGFTIPRAKWGKATSELAGHLTLQVHAQANQYLRASASDEQPSGSETYLVTLAMEHAVNSTVADEIRMGQAVQEYLSSIPADMRLALQVGERQSGETIVIAVPLSGRFGSTYAECFIRAGQHDLLGSGFFLQALIPGYLDPDTALSLASRLNAGDIESSHTVHTSPRLLGSWTAFQPQETSQRHRFAYIGFLPNAGPDFSGLAEHIEGLIREVCASWARVDEEIAFQAIVGGA